MQTLEFHCNSLQFQKSRLFMALRSIYIAWKTNSNIWLPASYQQNTKDKEQESRLLLNFKSRVRFWWSCEEALTGSILVDKTGSPMNGVARSVLVGNGNGNGSAGENAHNGAPLVLQEDIRWLVLTFKTFKRFFNSVLNLLWVWMEV